MAGGTAGRLIRIPGGALPTATIAVALACNVLGLSNIVPSGLILVIQLLVGCMLSQSINRNFWHDFLTIWKPCLLIILIYSATSVPFALLLIRIYGFDPVSAVLAVTPARMQDMDHPGREPQPGRGYGHAYAALPPVRHYRPDSFHIGQVQPKGPKEG